VRLRDQGWSISVSVNLSASDLLDDNLVEQVGCALAERSLPGNALRIEITESLLVDTGTGAADRLVRLRALGVDLAVDDYGTGYSCLAYLHDLPVSYLKIDRCFVDRMLRDERTALIVASTVQMAHGLGLKVVAEGLETAEQQDWLAEHACDLLQGYLLSKPLPAELLHRWLAERIHRPSARPARR
jgi:EAL domain-containing protein (putative c-di-GMP-specific phosphodiesterase class I)